MNIGSPLTKASTNHTVIASSRPGTEAHHSLNSADHTGLLYSLIQTFKASSLKLKHPTQVTKLTKVKVKVKVKDLLRDLLQLNPKPNYCTFPPYTVTAQPNEQTNELQQSIPSPYPKVGSRKPPTIESQGININLPFHGGNTLNAPNFQLVR